MNKATRIAATILGVYAGLLGMEHGVFEILQGNTPISGLMIGAIGPPCQADTAWHACLPALTLLPNYWITGILALLAGLVVVVWATGFVQRRNGGEILILLSLMMIPVGGGFVPAFTGVIGGAAGTRIDGPLIWWRNRSSKVLRLLAKLWPWTVIVLVIWFPAGWILGLFYNQAMMALNWLLFFIFDLVIPLLIVFSAFAQDILVTRA